jgi:hypothetical protein
LATAIVIQEPQATAQQSVPSSDININSDEVNEAPPEIDGILLDELSMFLDDSPNHDLPFAEVFAG